MRTVNRGAARREILRLANKARDSLGTCPDPYLMKHINRAVFCVRQNKLQTPGLMKAAGFNDKK